MPRRDRTVRLLRRVVGALVVAVVLLCLAGAGDRPAQGLELALSRVPWEGGPAYYADYPAARAAGWTDPAFFPVGVWYQSVLTQDDVDADQRVGINTYVELTEDSDLRLLRRNHMTAIASDRAVPPMPNPGAGLIGWLLDDEADMWGGAGDAQWTGQHPGEQDGAVCLPEGSHCGYTAMRTVRDRLPSGDGRLRYANYGKGVLMWQSDDQAAAFVNQFTQVVSADAYWYTDPNICEEGALHLGVPPGQCRSAANYGVVVDRMRALDERDGRPQPVWAFVEVGQPFEGSEQAIQPGQVEGAVMSSLIHEARGVIYFAHNFGGPCPSQRVLRDQCGALVQPTVYSIDNRIRLLAPVLNSQSYRHTFNPRLDTMLKAHDGAYYVFAPLA